MLHAKIFDTTGVQLLVHIAVVPCDCGKPTCKGETLGVRAQLISRFPRGLGLAQADCPIPVDLESLSVLIDSLQQSHARRIVELVQSTGHGLTTDQDARRLLVDVLKDAVR